MTDPTFHDYDAKYQAARRLEAGILPRNKTVVFDALLAAGIESVVIEFDVSGDNGQMEQPRARTADGTEVALPEQKITLERVDWSLGVVTESLDLPEAIEATAWHLLRDTHCGWENNDGGYGEFTFKVADRTITLEYNERYTETTYHEDQF